MKSIQQQIKFDQLEFPEDYLGDDFEHVQRQISVSLCGSSVICGLNT